jgi:hypothetical protein
VGEGQGIMKIPCIDCLVFVACKQRIRRMHKPDVTHFEEEINCPHLTIFIDRIHSEHGVIRQLEIDDARGIFGLDPPIDYKG